MKAPRLAYRLVVVALALTASTAASALPPDAVVPSPEAAAVLAARAPTDVAQLRLIQDQLKRVLEKALPATTSVEIGRAAGSGVIVSADGLVLTAAHVIGRPGRRAWVELPDGRRLRGTTLGADHNADAGMVKLDNPPDDLPFTPVAEGPPLEPGEWVVTTGQPGGLVEGRAPPVRLGRVLFRDDELLCTDCKLVGGDSGGPLFNMRGEVVGIHSSIGPMLTHNFHVPITAFRRDWQRLLAGELWGGRFDDEPDREMATLGVRGDLAAAQCLITVVNENMPAAKAGVKVGDVVTAIDANEVSTFAELKAYLARRRPGERITLRIKRGDESLALRIQLARPDGTIPEPRRPERDRDE
jgi:serine protease Do